MYFIQHLLFPGHLVSADDNVKETSYARELEELPLTIRERAVQLPPELLELVFMLPDIPSVSSSASFPEDFPVSVLPSRYQKPETLSAGLYRILQAIDPVAATKWHWRDIRKVRRSIEIALQVGRTYSDIISEQQSASDQPQCVLLLG